MGSCYRQLPVPLVPTACSGWEPACSVFKHVTRRIGCIPVLEKMIDPGTFCVRISPATCACSTCLVSFPLNVTRPSQLPDLAKADIQTTGFYRCPKAAFTFGITCSAINSIERRASFGFTQSCPQ